MKILVIAGFYWGTFAERSLLFFEIHLTLKQYKTFQIERLGA